MGSGLEVLGLVEGGVLDEKGRAAAAHHGGLSPGDDARLVTSRTPVHAHEEARLTTARLVEAIERAAEEKGVHRSRTCFVASCPRIRDARYPSPLTVRPTQSQSRHTATHSHLERCFTPKCWNPRGKPAALLHTAARCLYRCTR